MHANNRSLRLRLILAAGAAVIAALAVAGWGIGVMFERHVERRVVSELETDVRQLIAGFKVNADGQVALERLPADPRYDQLFSGRYWQVTREAAIVGRSRSLWDEKLALPDDELQSGGYHKHILAGPQGQRLIAIERKVSINRTSGVYSVRATVALDVSEISQAARAFRADLRTALGVLGSALLAAFALAINLGLAPLRRLRADLSTLRQGTAVRLTGHYPREVAPLVSDLNDLLDRQEHLIGKARARAADLAHGLKTPLTAISVISQELREKSDASTADELDEYAKSMQRTIEQELSRARSAHAVTPSASVRLCEVAEMVVRTMRRLPRGNELKWHIDIEKPIHLKVDRDAIVEVLGNILDNARKWSRTSVEISARKARDGLVIDISDDGPGVSDADRCKILDRGKRLDEAVPGSGFGLSIAASVMDEIGGRLEIVPSGKAGLCAKLNIPKHLVDDELSCR